MKSLALVTIACLVLLFSESASSTSCGTGWQLLNGDCFKVIINSTLRNVYDARQVCSMAQADLASIANYALETSLYNYFLTLSPKPSHVYIGLNDISMSSNYTWLDGSSVTYTNLSAANQPSTNSLLSGVSCTALYSSDGLWTHNGKTYWQSVPCCFNDYNITAALCRMQAGASMTVNPATDLTLQTCYSGCPSKSWTLNSSKNKCYMATSTSTTYPTASDARLACLALGADLPSISSPSDDNFAASVMRAQHTKITGFYVGLNSIGSTSYHYLDGTAVNASVYSPWTGNTPANASVAQCVIMTTTDVLWSVNTSHTWKGEQCCTSQNISWALCERPSGSSVAIAHDNDTYAITCYGAINECASSPCVFGTCTDHVLGYQCACTPGYTGSNCQTEINYCTSSPCQNGATCNMVVNGYTCTCMPGYNGTLCQNLYDACMSTPCQNNGTCTTLPSAYSCMCLNGTSGSHCETVIDQCIAHNVTCLNGGTCMHGINTYHCACATGFFNTFCDKSALCYPGNGPYVANATANATSTSTVNAVFGDTVTYKCFPGFKFPDMTTNVTIYCNQSAYWSATPPACQPSCSQLPVVANSVTQNPALYVGASVNFTCNKGYQYPDNSTTWNVTCLPGRVWSVNASLAPQCSIVNCPVLPLYSHQTLDSRNTTYNTTITFWCDVGYVLPDNTTARTIKCMSTGAWSAKLPACQPVRCPIIPPLANNVANTTNNTYNTYVQYTCQGNTRMQDGATWRVLKCDATWEWSDDVTDCQPNRCFPLPYVANATPSTTDALLGTITTLTCISGHTFDPNGKLVDPQRTMQCQQLTLGKFAYSWYPILSACKPLFCGPQPNASNAVASTDSLLYSTVLQLTCIKGYYYPDNSTVASSTCMASQLWNNTNIPPCSPVYCNAPPDITLLNGTSDVAKYASFVYQTTVHYTCWSGFLFADGYQTRNLTCNEFGHWTDTDVSCRKDRCLPVYAVANTQPSTTKTQWFTNVTYTCITGYEWVTPGKPDYYMTCQNTGDWNISSSAISKCKPKTCLPAIPPMNNATTNGTGGNTYTANLTYTCNIGFQFSDNTTMKTMNCNANGQWAPNPFDTCQIIHCPALPVVGNATINTNETSYGTTVTYSCLSGYQYDDRNTTKTVYCTANGTWTPFPAACQVVYCPPVPDYMSGVVFKTPYYNNFSAEVTYWCDSNYVFAAYANDTDPSVKDIKLTSKCLLTKEWSPPFQTCQLTTNMGTAVRSVIKESAQGATLGTGAMTFVGVMAGCILLLDIHKLVSDIKWMKGNVQSLINANKK